MNDDSKLNGQALFDVKQCEELYQHDKFQKMRSDIERIRSDMHGAKQSELAYYGDLNLSQQAKMRIFGVQAPMQHHVPKIVVWDPIEGNLIMTEQDYKRRYQV